MNPCISQRKDVRLKFMNIIQYEKIKRQDVYGYGAPTATTAVDISARGIGFYANEEFELNSNLRISCNLTSTEIISFQVRVVRMELFTKGVMKFIVGSEIKEITDESRAKLEAFLARINIFPILESCILENVSDMHFLAGSPLIIKKKGELMRVGEELDGYTVRSLLLNTLDDDRHEKLMKEKDVNFVFHYHDKRFRANIHFQQGNLEGFFRVSSSAVESPDVLGLPSVLGDFVSKAKKGLVLIAGNTGSGKTTTLSSLIGHLSKEKPRVIFTIEDPIEYIHEGSKGIIKQRELGRDTVSYASAIKNAMKQSPDVLVIGEIHDQETMALALTAAEAGILVLATLNASSTSHALDRVFSFFPPDTQKHVLNRLSLVLKGVIVQEIFPKISGDGFIPAVEVFLPDQSFRETLAEGEWKHIAEFIAAGKGQGMRCMKDAVQELVDDGVIDQAYLNEYI